MLHLHIDTIHENSNYRMKDREKALIFHTLYTTKATTRKSIADNLSMRPVTVSRIIRELIEDRLVLEDSQEGKTGKGRPGINIKVNYSRFVAVSVGVISREIIGSLVDLSGNVINSLSIYMPEKADNAVLLQTINEIIKKLAAGISATSELAGIGLSLPGTVHIKQKEWVSSSRWPDMKNLSLTDLGTTPTIPVIINRFMDPELEVLLSTCGSCNEKNALLFHWGYGIGSAVAVRGKILTSSFGRFGEVGHWNIVPGSFKKCRCGSYGCLETEAALWALLPEIKKIYPDAPEDESDFSPFIREHNPENLEIINRAMEHVATSLANLCKIFYPDKIFLKGPFFEVNSILHAMKTLFQKQIPEYTETDDLFEVVSGSNGAVYGSVYNLFRNTLRPLMKTRGNV